MMRRTAFMLGLVAVAALPPPAWPIQISATGNYSQGVDATNLTGGAGTDLTSAYTSGASATQLSITNAGNQNDNWRVDVRRIDGTWHASLVLRVRRTTDGVSCGARFNNQAPSGGTAYITVTTANQTFFSGKGDKCSIGIQYELSGISVAIPPGTYSTTVVYTLVDT